ncbi:hypothetical protein DIPPA_04421 [Diplonema papillatum]|nr:hypothetical protein DIPPA_04421 [Diplonema papillatum]
MRTLPIFAVNGGVLAAQGGEPRAFSRSASGSSASGSSKAEGSSPAEGVMVGHLESFRALAANLRALEADTLESVVRRHRKTSPPETPLEDLLSFSWSKKPPTVSLSSSPDTSNCASPPSRGVSPLSISSGLSAFASPPARQPRLKHAHHRISA